MAAKAYSYLRFSTLGQLGGDSLRRQTEAARKYAELHGLDIDESLTFRDLGMSAFHGKNAVEGALANFIEAVDTGRVAPGSYLLVENLDRLSRDRIMPALMRFTDLLGKGIRIVTLSDGQEYDSDSINDLTGLLVPLVTMHRAHEESALKSKRGRATWKQKKARAADGELVTRMVPAWINVRDNGKMELDKRKAKVVQKIFELAASGWGTTRIARQFNIDEVPVFGRGHGWGQSYIRRILRNPAVIGQYQPHRNTHENGGNVRIPDGDPIDGYFPPVIEESLFYSVKHTKRGPSGHGDRLPQNLLSKLVFCGRCGAPMHYFNKGGGYQYLACDNRRRFKSCDAPAVQYIELLLDVIMHLDDYRNYDPGGQIARERNRKIDALIGQIAETKEAIGRLVDSLERVSSETMEQRLVDLEATLAALTAKHEELKERAAIINRPVDIDLGDDPLAEYIIYEGKKSVPKDKVESVRAGRAHIAAEIRRHIARIEAEKGKPLKVTPISDGLIDFEVAEMLLGTEKMSK